MHGNFFEGILLTIPLFPAREVIIQGLLILNSIRPKSELLMHRINTQATESVFNTPFVLYSSYFRRSTLDICRFQSHRAYS
ncbi:hypothetical protein HSR121_1113 [Halapricum desulfuricans]|uniref:Uncharacterized protein n=1 Tax=Halapricum desulfuricans TaxID=2841257 RepID=A0A897MTJ8_9EURY|nr:hypothetical protein HSR121_1113 [Halapricum desulfuricans]